MKLYEESCLTVTMFGQYDFLTESLPGMQAGSQDASASQTEGSVDIGDLM